MKVYYDKDCDLSLIKGKTVAIIGYGSQGHAHAQNLNDSGVKVVVGLRKGGASWPKVEKAGLKVAEVADAVKSADVVMILLPDEQIAEVYKKDVEPNIKPGASLVFAHGFNVHYGFVTPRAASTCGWCPEAPAHRAGALCAVRGVPHLGPFPGQSGKARDLPCRTPWPTSSQGRHHRYQLPRRNRDRPVRHAVLSRPVELIRRFETRGIRLRPEMAIRVPHELNDRGPDLRRRIAT